MAAIGSSNPLDPSGAAARLAQPQQTDISNSEFVETRSVTLEWKVTNLKHLFESSKGDAKSKCVKSALFDAQKWQIFLYPNSGLEQYCSLYLSCEPTAAEKERGLAESAGWNSNGSTNGVGKDQGGGGGGGGGGNGTSGTRGDKGPWKREGKFKFSFELRSVDRRMTFKQMEANDHSFSDTARNWGYAQYLKRSECYYNNPTIRLSDAMLIVCTIVYSPTPPTPPPLPRLLIPKDLVRAYASLFDDPDYADVVFRIVPDGRPGVKEKRLYAARKVLSGRCEYFETMFNSGFGESLRILPSSSAPTTSTTTTTTTTTNLLSSPAPSRPNKFAELEDEDDFSSDEDEGSYDSEDEQVDDDDDEEDFESSSASDEEEEDEIIEHPESEGQEIEATATQSEEPEEEGKEVEEERPASSYTAVSDDEGVPRPSTPENMAGNRQSGFFVDAPVAPDSPIKPTTTTTTRGGQKKGKKGTGSTSRAGKEKRGKKDDRRPRFEVVVTDAAYTSYRALLYYLYTDSITFLPLASTYHVAREAALSSPSSSSIPFPSRRAYLLANVPPSTSSGNNFNVLNTGSSSAGCEPCSAKAIYRLADKLGLQELKERAFEHVVKGLSVQNIPYEVFGSFSSRFPSIQSIEIAFLLEKWNEVRASPSMKRVLMYVRSGRFPGFEEVWGKLLENLQYVPSTGTSGTTMIGGGTATAGMVEGGRREEEE